MSGFKRLWGKQWFRLVVLGGLVLASVVLLVFVLRQSEPGRLLEVGTVDFTQYWAAARLLLQRQNPYDAVLLLAAERAAGWAKHEPILMWNPPWTLALALPYAALPFGTAAKAWLITNILLVLACGVLLWRAFAPLDAGRLWLGGIAAVAFVPVMLALQMGQISPWLLVGITGFLMAVRARRDGLAGASLVLLTIKPHVGYLFLFGIAWWIVREHRWRVLLGGAAALTAACAAVELISPAVFGQYLRAAASPPLYWRSATLGTWLRTAFGAEQRWLQFLPTGIGLAGFVVWAIRHKGKWDWLNLAPGLLLASAISAAYGWGFDQVTLLPVVVLLITSLRFMPQAHRAFLLGVYMLAQVGLLLQTQFMVDSSVAYWHPIVLTGLYAWQQWNIRHNQVNNEVN